MSPINLLIFLSRRISRRNFLKHLSALSIVALSFPKLLLHAIENSRLNRAKGLPLDQIESIPLKSLNKKQAKMVQALATQIVPTDEDPGAYEAGVILHIDEKISKSLKLQNDYKDGLVLVNQLSTQEFLKGFTELPPEEQYKICKMLYESNKKSKEYRFFNLIRKHVFEGFYTSKIAQGMFNLPGNRIISDY